MNLQQINGAWESIVDFLLPRICCGCGVRVMQQQWLVCEKCLDAIPPLPQPICPVCGCPDAELKANGRCTDCPMGKIWFQQARGYAVYNGTARTLVEKLKYGKRLEYARLMALRMAHMISDQQKSQFDIITSVPLHSTRQRDRGFNQASHLANEISTLTGIPFHPSILQRDKPTPSQTRLKKRQRRDNIAGAFSLRKKADISGKTILLIDDVYTTGSTLNECSRVLMQAGAHSVHCLAFARAPLSA